MSRNSPPRIIVIASFAITMLFFMINFAYSGDPVKGKQLFQDKLCWQCHGKEGDNKAFGKQINTKHPILAGQNKDYLLEQMKFIREEKRDIFAWTSICRFRMKKFDGTILVTDAEFEDMAEWLANQPCK